jgi:hypothetical protein
MSSAFAKSVNRPLLLTLGVASSLIGCMAEVRGEPAYAEVEYVPADIEVYPHTVYAGETVYLVGDRWYYRRGPHWVYYTHEPPDLVRYRAHVERAPRAPRREYYRYERAAPPAPKREYYERGAKRSYYAPRAHRHPHDRRPDWHDARRHGHP